MTVGKELELYMYAQYAVVREVMFASSIIEFKPKWVALLITILPCIPASAINLQPPSLLHFDIVSQWVLGAAQIIVNGARHKQK